MSWAGICTRSVGYTLVWGLLVWGALALFDLDPEFHFITVAFIAGISYMQGLGRGLDQAARDRPDLYET